VVQVAVRLPVNNERRWSHDGCPALTGRHSVRFLEQDGVRFRDMDKDGVMAAALRP